MIYLKRAEKSPTTGEEETRQTVQAMLAEIESGGEDKAREYAANLDKWTGDIIVSPDEIKAAGESLSQRARDDIKFAYERVKKFAQAQLQSMTEFETELSPGLIAGQRLIPVQTAGCYIPGGRYAHIASAVMSVTTAKVAGVKNVIACSPTRGDAGVHRSERLGRALAIRPREPGQGDSHGLVLPRASRPRTADGRAGGRR